MNGSVQTEIPKPTHSHLRRLLERLFSRSENFTAGRYWMLETLFLAVMFSVLFCGGVDNRLSVASGDYWFPAYFQKIEHPLLDVAKNNPPGNHEAKLNFRLTVPVILHALHVPADQRWTLPALAACGTCVLILISCAFAFRVTGDRVCGLYAALAVSATYTGSFGFTLYYDTLALAQIALAMLPGVSWFWKGILVFTASFTDERALLASLFLLVQSFCMNKPLLLHPSLPMAGKPPEGGTREWPIRFNNSTCERIFCPDFLAVVAGMTAYCVGRLALEKFAGLTSPHAGIGLGFLLTNAPFWHAGTWFALKGGWLVVAIAGICLWQNRQFPAFSAFVFAIGVCVGCGFLVDDVLRSTTYVFPAFLMALMILGPRENKRWMRIYCLTAFVISAVAGNYNVWRSQITWFQPVAARVLHHGLRAIIGEPFPK